MTDLLCIYHKNCADGFAAALAVKTWADENHLTCEFIPAHYGDTPPDVTGKAVYIVDFSYPRDVLIEMHSKALSLRVIDHHKSAQKDCEGLSFCIFDMEKSGAVLTWLTLFNTKPVPQLFEYIQDRDLWQWEMIHSKAVSAALQMLKHDFIVWGHYLSDQQIPKLIDRGHTIIRYQRRCIEKSIAPDNVAMIEIAGHTVPCINTTHLISEIGNELAKGHPFCAMYFETANKRIYSLRSDKNGIDVSEIAKLFGGGGHYHAAGFFIDIPSISWHENSQGQPVLMPCK